MGVAEADEDNFIQIQETQAALRDSIAQAKALAEESDRRIRRHGEAAAETGTARAEGPRPV